MKVCFISLKAYPLFDSSVRAMHGGAEVQMSILAKHLSKYKQFEVSVITAKYKKSKKKKVGNVSIWPSFSFELFTLFKIYIFFKVFNKVNADIYIQRTLSFYSFFLAAYCKFKKKKLIYMVAHDNDLNGKEVLYKYPFGKWLAKKLFEDASAVIVQNEFQYNLFRERFQNKNLFVMKKIAEISENSSNFEHYARYSCVWLARAESWKHPEKFIELADLNPSLKFLMICPSLSLSFSQKKYNKLITQLDKRVNITFLQHLPYESIFPVLKNCKVFCSTSSCEGDLPMSLLEAATLGLPILLLSINNFNDSTNDSIGIYCNDSVELMNEWLQKLISDEELYKDYSDEAKDYINKYHNKDLIIPQFIEILNTVNNT